MVIITKKEREQNYMKIRKKDNITKGKNLYQRKEILC